LEIIKRYGKIKIAALIRENYFIYGSTIFLIRIIWVRYGMVMFHTELQSSLIEKVI